MKSARIQIKCQSDGRYFWTSSWQEEPGYYVVRGGNLELSFLEAVRKATENSPIAKMEML